MELLSGALVRVGLAVIGLLSLVAVAEGLRTRGVRSTTTRAIVHVGVAAFLVLTPRIFEYAASVFGLALAFSVVNHVTRNRGWWLGTHGGREESWGTVTFPLSVLPCLAATWLVDPGRIYIFQVAYAVLGLADPIATWMGTRIRQSNHFRQGRDGKSVTGSGAFFVIAVVLSWGIFALSSTSDPAPAFSFGMVAAALGVGLVSTLAEALGSKGWDNFFIPVSVVVTILIARQSGVYLLWVGLLCGGLFGVLADRAGMLDRKAASVAGLFAASLIAGGGWMWLVPGVVFFALSSSLSQLPGNGYSARERGQQLDTGRSIEQVLANGGVAWVCLVGALAWSDPFWYVAAIGAFAAAAADTWATEIGTRIPSKPRSLRTGARVEPGTSGAVSWAGTLGAVAGAGTVVGAAFLVAPSAGQSLVVEGAGLVGAGVLGMLVDSIVGATIQAQYRDPENQAIVDTPPADGARPVRGWAVINNEMVNLVGTLAGAAAALLL